MNSQLVIDALVRQTMVLIARLSTVDGVRSPLSHIADNVFVSLVKDSSLLSVVGDLFESWMKRGAGLKEWGSGEAQVVSFVACDDAGYDALKLKQVAAANRAGGTRNVAELIYDKCTGCNLCVAVCPVPECMELYDSKGAFPYQLHSSYADNTL